MIRHLAISFASMTALACAPPVAAPPLVAPVNPAPVPVAAPDAEAATRMVRELEAQQIQVREAAVAAAAKTQSDLVAAQVAHEAERVREATARCESGRAARAAAVVQWHEFDERRERLSQWQNEHCTSTPTGRAVVLFTSSGQTLKHTGPDILKCAAMPRDIASIAHEAEPALPRPEVAECRGYDAWRARGETAGLPTP
jgi:hypothetical protein